MDRHIGIDAFLKVCQHTWLDRGHGRCPRLPCRRGDEAGEHQRSDRGEYCQAMESHEGGLRGT
jgi:hypothetical protein